MATPASLEQRIARLEQALKIRTMIALGAVTVAVALFATVSFAESQLTITEELRTRRLVVVDDQDRMRVEIGEDAETVDRYSRAAGLTIYDDKGAERGGLATLADGSAVIALDAPRGIGSTTPDRAGIKVAADGSALVAVISNNGDLAAALQSDISGGRVELYKHRDGKDVLRARTLTFDVDETQPLGAQQSPSKLD